MSEDFEALGKGGLAHWDEVQRQDVSAGGPQLGFLVQDLGAATGATVAAALRLHLQPNALAPEFAVLEGRAPQEELGLVLAGTGQIEAFEPGEDASSGAYPLRTGSVLLRRGWTRLAYRAGAEGLDLLLFAAHVLPPPVQDHVVAVAALDGIEVETLDKGVFALAERDIGRALGSALCGVRHDVLPAGAWSCPPHWHSREHELFVVLEGDGRLLLFDNRGQQRAEHALRAGSVVSRPAATGVAHALAAGDGGMTYLAFGTRDPGEIVYYPRSRKAFLGPLLARVEPVDDYWEGEL
jgi:uncharacterized cupin superfamily protein